MMLTKLDPLPHLIRREKDVTDFFARANISPSAVRYVSVALVLPITQRH